MDSERKKYLRPTRPTDTDRPTPTDPGRQTGRQAGRQTDRQTDRQTGRQAGRQTDRQTDSDRQTEAFQAVVTEMVEAADAELTEFWRDELETIVRQANEWLDDRGNGNEGRAKASLQFHVIEALAMVPRSTLHAAGMDVFKNPELTRKLDEKRALTGQTMQCLHDCIGMVLGCDPMEIFAPPLLHLVSFFDLHLSLREHDDGDSCWNSGSTARLELSTLRKHFAETVTRELSKRSSLLAGVVKCLEGGGPRLMTDQPELESIVVADPDVDEFVVVAAMRKDSTQFMKTVFNTALPQPPRKMPHRELALMPTPDAKKPIYALSPQVQFKIPITPSKDEAANESTIRPVSLFFICSAPAIWTLRSQELSGHRPRIGSLSEL